MINVLLFAHLKDQVGTDRLTLDQEQMTVKELLELLMDKHSLTNVENVMVAINEEYSVEEDIIKAGDTVALIPPVSGG
ncbi:molybdopterin converting factor subunit 1 [Bacillus suaedaesalsae]|uniref:Molybdopterin synthase sulfur carrier subunit n=1 Tax=Bacillus suaedaesalsae TaxID=2810349 RepID=A0ABS2DK53_9BACI|nr:molybdopterin converting factor subunit 1 [Bacillus suaedaesalsae]MBM6618781.1 molybdopterin converting factor subunit 1 [Bacillus suaedaesalsae]